LFLVPAALAEQKTVIVVVLYTALANNLSQCAAKVGVDCKQWRRDYTDGELYTLVIVSADIAIDGDFLYYARGLERAGRLKAVFFDKAHVSYTDTSYRQKLREL
jgi:hypothetical protein